MPVFPQFPETFFDGPGFPDLKVHFSEAGTYCNRDFEQQERVEYHDGGGQYLYLRGLPGIEITAIYGSDTWEWDEGNLIPADYYQLLPAGLVACRSGPWPYGPKALKVTYTGGYDSPLAEGEEEPERYLPIPTDLEMAIRNQVTYDFKRRKDIGLESIRFPDGSIQNRRGSKISGGIGFGAKYANVHIGPAGSKVAIRPKNKKFLAIPLPAARTGRECPGVVPWTVSGAPPSSLTGC
jgi:hypothetical protein